MISPDFVGQTIADLGIKCLLYTSHTHELDDDGGGAFGNAAIFALGVMPYITASIIIQLMGMMIPYFQKRCV